MPWLRVLALSVLLSWPCSAVAHVVSDRDVHVLSQIPAGAVSLALARFAPDSLGYVRPNAKEHWLSVGRQRPAMLLLMDALSHSDTLAAERAWRAIDAVWFEQQADGGFVYAAGSPADPGDSPAALGAEAAWLAALARAQIATTNSPVVERFRWRHALQLPKFKHAMDHLEARASRLLDANSADAGALMVAAAAFLLAEGMFHDMRYGRAGHEALSRALALQRPDGALPLNGQDNLAHHTIGLESLQSIAIYFPSPTMESASRRAADWLSAHASGAALKQMDNAISTPGSWSISAGETDFVMRYAAIRPPPPAAATHEPEH